MNTFYKYSILSAVMVVAFISVVPSYGYPDGAPNLICVNMTPEHPPTTTVGSPPFIIKVKSNLYAPGVAVKGVISSPTKTKFKGFLLEARSTTSEESYGTFQVANEHETKEIHGVCGAKNTTGLTHSNNTEKAEVRFEWMPPATPVGDLRFKLTVVESIKPSRYWLNIYSNTLTASTIY